MQELSKALADNLPLDESRFTQIKDKELRPSFNLTGLKLLRDKAGRERDLRELYRNRAPYELLQNGDDAKARTAVFILTDEGLGFAHDGNWFTVANFRSLADGWSDKDPSQCIGHKGLGFRSVLDITPSPHLLNLNSKNFFAVKFSWALNHGHFQETFKREPALRSYYESWTKNGQLVCPVMSIPGLAKKQNLGTAVAIYDTLIKGHYGEVTTLFWLPIADPEIPKRNLDDLGPTPVSESDLREFVNDYVPTLLPFLKSIEKVYLFRTHEQLSSVILRTNVGDQRNKGVVSVTTNDGGSKRTSSFFQMHSSIAIPPNISADSQTPKAVRAMQSAGVILSVPLRESQPTADKNSVFHVYFPTEQETGFGFVIHGDFYLKPDRTRLMSGRYNEWLLKAAGRMAANEFLSELIERYDASAIFDSLAPTGEQNAAADTLRDAFSESLAKRKRGFIPSNLGRLTSDEAALPPSVDSEGFWDSHFSDVCSRVLQGKKGFVLPSIDNNRTRRFLQLAQVDMLDPSQTLDFIESAAEGSKPMSWWYDCYSFLSHDNNLALKDQSYFSGRKLIPISDKSILSVSENRDRVICLSPRGDSKNLQVPACFASSFVFLNPALARLVLDGKDAVRSWVLDRFHISRFEASDLLPRAIRNVAPKIYNGTIALTRDELKDLWAFVFRVIQLSRAPIEEVDFWQNIGRLPLPTESTKRDDGELTPAFLLYWGDRQRSESIVGIQLLKTVSTEFVDELVTLTDVSKKDWLAFFHKAGVSNSPQFRSYSRVIGSDSEIPLDESVTRADGPYSGERQRDLNRAAIACVHKDWTEIVKRAPKCAHDAKQVLQSLGVIEGFDESVEMAEREYGDENVHWRERLWSLIRTLPSQALAESNNDSVHCYGGGRGGHSKENGRYVNQQLDKQFLPSSLGPATRNECFMRHPARRIISTGVSAEELGDSLLPYVVADDYRDLEKLRQLGVESLDDAASASTDALTRALKYLGDRLSTDWGQQEILSERARWRLVRGAIQDMYRTLNQKFSNEATTARSFTSETKFGVRSGDEIKFVAKPFHYARPGSPIEAAFRDKLHLFDADRPLPSLFEAIGVTELKPGETVLEHFDGATNFVPAKNLRYELQTEIAPLLLAYVIADSGSNATEQIINRLERFEIHAVRNLSVSFSLVANPKTTASVDYRHFYLQSELAARARGGRERRFTLYVKGTDSTSIADIDADEFGAILATVFDDAASAEMQGTFARIVARYQTKQGHIDEMQEYLLSNLGISGEAQESAKAILAGEVVTTPAAPPPPPAQVHQSLTDETEGELGESLEQQLRKHQIEIQKKATTIVTKITSTGSKPSGKQKPVNVSHGTSAITPEQEKRGFEGEEEIKRRLQLPGGWMGFTLIKDRRNDGCGYDFLCELSGQEVMLEVKTFIPTGRIFVSSLELQMAVTSGKDYYLIGVVYEGSPNDWATHLLCDPAKELLLRGEFDIQAQLKLHASDLFD